MVTIAMCTHNSELSVASSIQSLLRQNYIDWKLYIVDAKSNDQTISICRKFQAIDSRITVIEKNYQQSWNLSVKEVLELADSEFFFILDGDDYISPDYLEKLLPAIESTKSIGAYGKNITIDKSGRIYYLHISNNKRFYFTSFHNSLSRLSCALITPESLGLVNILYSVWKTQILKELSTQHNVFSEARGWPGDYDRKFILDCLERGPIASVKGPKIFRRLKFDVPKTAIEDKYFNFNRMGRFFLTTIFTLLELLRKKPPYQTIFSWARSKPSRSIYILFYCLRIAVWFFGSSLTLILSVPSRWRKKLSLLK